MNLSVVVPALDAASGIGATLIALRRGPASAEIIVVDGGSRDDTCAIARRLGACVVHAPRGRGGQMAQGARSARGDWLLFLHADTVPGEGWERALRDFMADPRNGRRAAVFRLRLDDPARRARFLEWVAAQRARWLGLPYGDQGLLISRAFHDELGGFRALPIMEDVDMVRRIGRGRLVTLDCVARTSAARYRRAGYALRALRNLTCLTAYFLGVPPRLIVRLYG